MAAMTIVLPVSGCGGGTTKSSTPYSGSYSSCAYRRASITVTVRSNLNQRPIEGATVTAKRTGYSTKYKSETNSSGVAYITVRTVSSCYDDYYSMAATVSGYSTGSDQVEIIYEEPNPEVYLYLSPQW